MDKDPVRKFFNKDVNYGRHIGQGGFGIVFEGTLKGERIAIKVPMDKLRNDVLNELKFLAKLKHPNVVYFYGVLVEDSGIKLIFEFLAGDTRAFVRNPEITPETLLGISYDISLGMDYIHDLNIIHRDLAARNVLLDSKNTAKISDFGLSRLVDRDAQYFYSVKPSSVLPIRWMPRESLPLEGGKGRFNKRSDIWSFGVTLWEVWNKAETPYANLNDEEVRNALCAGQNPMSFEISEGIPGEIKKLLEDIFAEEELRPSFANIKIFLNNLKKGKRSSNTDIWWDCQENQKAGQSSNSAKNGEFFTAKSNFPEEGASAPPGLNFEKIKINEAFFRLTPDNVDILSSLKENTKVKILTCLNISVKKIEEIIKKFKGTENLNFLHTRDSFGKCMHFDSTLGRRIDVSEDCIFQLPQMKYRNLKELYVHELEINTENVNIGPENLPALKKLGIYLCKIEGNLVDTILTPLFALEWIYLWGNTPLLEKRDVEALLMMKSLKYLNLNKWEGREVVSGSFMPIGPNGKLLDQIMQNAKIIFVRSFIGRPWKLSQFKL